MLAFWQTQNEYQVHLAAAHQQVAQRQAELRRLVDPIKQPNQ